MKYCSIVLVTFVVFIFPSVVDAQITFERCYGGPETDIGYSVAQTADRGYIIAGRSGSFGAGSYDVYLVKTDSLGDTLWTKTYGGSDWDSGLSVTPTFSGGYVVSGFTESFTPIGADVYL